MISKNSIQLGITEEDIFSEVTHFLLRKNNRLFSNDQLIEKTGISSDLIFKWVKSGKLNSSLFPNLGAPCEKCGNLTNHSKICRECSQSITHTLKQEEKDKIWFDKIQRKPLKANAYRHKF
ncbi:hypothetical protein [Rummeliibacillus suwonensis]|jgi:hypothetical protein|uniref:hypothetical protein n=1 Tax=Rummeliibacillus suwonensis TaxID=1306154 RepID=UPI0011B7DF7A|nr:hypothetical protein [Rummeliibacillus suwonensis]MBO2536776.1 hypothetical protein [Rummeliibacillus suwonensis]